MAGCAGFSWTPDVSTLPYGYAAREVCYLYGSSVAQSGNLIESLASSGGYQGWVSATLVLSS